MDTAPSQRVISSSILISSNATHVHINEEGISCAADFISEKLLTVKRLDAGRKSKTGLRPNGGTQQEVDRIFFIDCMNFCFWTPAGSDKFTVNYQNNTYTGYHALLACICKSIDNGLPLVSPEYYSKITVEILKQVLKSDSNGDIPLIEERVAILREVGTVLCEQFNGSFINFLNLYGKNSQMLIEKCLEYFPNFRDECKSYHKSGEIVYFYKRVQILIADIWDHFNGEGLGYFDNTVSMLTMFPDYRVPQILFQFKVLEFSAHLLTELRNFSLLPKSGQIEQEIRGCSIQAVEKIKNKLNENLTVEQHEMIIKNGWSVCSVCIDFFLWDWCKENQIDIENIIPHHRVLTTFY